MNGDLKRVEGGTGVVVYTYAAARTTHTMHPSGLEVFEFPNGQVRVVRVRMCVCLCVYLTAVSYGPTRTVALLFHHSILPYTHLLLSVEQYYVRSMWSMNILRLLRCMCARLFSFAVDVLRLVTNRVTLSLF